MTVASAGPFTLCCQR